MTERNQIDLEVLRKAEELRQKRHQTVEEAKHRNPVIKSSTPEENLKESRLYDELRSGYYNPKA